MLTSHFLLDLQDAHQRKIVYLDSSDPLGIARESTSRSALFTTALGSLSATIGPPSWVTPLNSPNAVCEHRDPERGPSLEEGIIELRSAEGHVTLRDTTVL